MARRRLFVTAVLGLAMGGLLIMTGIGQRTALISPGALTTHHQGGEGCQDCHAMGEGELLDWVDASFHTAKVSDQSQRCLKCHQELGESGLFAHGLPPDVLAQVTDESESQNEKSSESLLLRIARLAKPEAGKQLACMTCHVEHRGEDFDMTAMVDLKCQLCHSQTFSSFNQGHPEISQHWYPRRTRIHFNHASHELVHVANYARSTPGQGDVALDFTKVMRCTNCHFSDATGKSMHTHGYEVSCASCHDYQITDRETASIDVLRWAAPQVPANSVAIAQTPFMRLLMPTSTVPIRGRPSGVALPEEGGEFSPSALDDFLSQTNLGTLISDLLHRNRPNLEQRLTASIGPHADQTAVQQLADALSNLDLSGADRSRLLALIAMESVPEAESSQTDTGREDSPVSPTAWSLERNDEIWTLAYRPKGHADPLLKACLELGARYVQADTLHETDESESPLHSLFRQWTEPTFSGRCMKCHTVETDAEGRLQMVWQTHRPRSDSHGFTEFDHGPHLTLGELATCTTCHPVALERDLVLFRPEFVQRDNTICTDSGAPNSSGFLSLGKAVCANCHQPDKVGESCLTCHKYHVFGH